MIVKNESHIIAQTLANLCENFPINYWIISDTGSTDNTIEIIENFFKKENISGYVHQSNWQDFSYNRNLALEQCIGKSDYILIFDADDSIHGNLNLPQLQHDAYYFRFSSPDLSSHYYRKLLIKNNSSFRWRGVLHEFLESSNEDSRLFIEGDYYVISGRKGHRNSNPNKYFDDAQILEKAFATEEDKTLLPRYAYYCAQSYRDADMIDPAIKWYKKRLELEGWIEEKYLCFQYLGLLHERQENHKEAIYYWQQGINLVPERAECWYHIARRNSWDGHYHLAYCFSRHASQIDLPTGNRLFLNRPIYLFWCWYEYCLTSYKLELLEESYSAYKQLLMHCHQDLVNRLQHHFPHYLPFIQKDKFIEVQTLIKNLKRLERLDLIDQIYS